MPPILPKDQPAPRYREFQETASGATSDAESNLGIDNEEPTNPGKFEMSGPGLSTKAQVRKDGMIGVTFNDIMRKLPDLPPDYAAPVAEYGIDTSRPLRVPVLNIVIFIVGSRGDVQPYLAAGLELIRTYGHRVRIATHDIFELFVLEQAVHLEGKLNRQGNPLKENLEFFGIGGDPKGLMAYMVKIPHNPDPGMTPGMTSLRNGDIGRKQSMINENGAAFAADAIISNPPAFAHIHTAEALGIPLIMSFTRLLSLIPPGSGKAMPWSATTEFSHPLVEVEQSNTPSRLTNYLTFAMAATLTWQGLGRTINKFRKKQLGLDSISLASGASVLDRLKIPYLYCWDAELIPKPRDWMQNIDITGFLFLDSDPGYRPPDDLARFLDASRPSPVYIGFGSIVVDNPVALTRILLEAIRLSGVRALLSAGWSKMGEQDIPENVFLLGGSWGTPTFIPASSDVPHDWLFAEKRVSAVCIHGGAGTTAIALKNGLPVVVVPFFGDQPFWGAMIANRGAGPEPLPFKTLTAEKLAVALEFALSDKARAAAAEVGTSIRREVGPLHKGRVEGKAMNIEDAHLERIGWRGQFCAGFPCSSATVAYAVLVSKIALSFLSMRKLAIDTRFLGLETLPSLYGTKERRPRTKVKDARSGFVAGGKGLAFGFYDGITGMVLDPMKGAQSEGVVGFAKGFARASVNLTVQPAAGIFGLFSHPVKGIGKSISNSLRPELGEVVLQQPRYALGLQEVKLAEEATKQDLIRQFDQLAKTVRERKKMLKDEAKQWMREVEKIAARAQEVEEVVRQPSNVHQR
ncbi:hypothetical protein QFC21_007272 [Naganishia friedmannii]|uniref:Uncharacterized protein n=1 Tax=Naganishia friedmannii TaxID=89922 RepID=A0ACC2UW50_9TREE|nr:hypothetical protein QFC21_007272 [Naganishia friedmannii]